jgi:DNA-binding CsgD family transcriptional regulator
MMPGMQVCFGLASYWAWGYLCFHTPALLGSGTGNPDLNACYIVSLVGASVTMTLGFLFEERAEKALRSRLFLWICAALTSLSSAGMAVFAGGRSGLVVALISGLASGVLPLAWGLWFGIDGALEVERSVPVAGVLASLLLIVSHAMPSWAAFFCTLALPMVSCAALPNGDEEPSAVIRHVGPPRVASSLRLLAPSVVAFGCALGSFRSSLFEGIGGDPTLGSVLFFGGMCTASAFYWLVGRVAPGRLSADSVYKVALPVVIASLALLSSDDSVVRYVSGVLQGAGFACFDLAVWTMSAGVSRRTRISPVAIFAFTRLASHAGMLVGAVVGTCIESETIDLVPTAALIECLLVAAVLASLGGMRIISVRESREASVAGGATESSTCFDLQVKFGLTDREAEVAAYLLEGASRERIAEELVLTTNTIKTHVQHVYEKTGVHSRAELADLVRGKVR